MMARIFSKYKLRTRFWLKPGLSSLTGGSVVGYFDPDVNDNPSYSGAANLTSNIQDAGSHYGARTFNNNDPSMSWEMPSNVKVGGLPQYYMGTVNRDPTLCYQARFVIEVAKAVASPPTAVDYGLLMCDWEVDFWDPQSRLTDAPSAISGTLSVFQASATLTGAVSFFPITVDMNTYIAHGDGPVRMLTSPGYTGYPLALMNNGTLYMIISQGGTSISAPSVTYYTVGGLTSVAQVVVRNVVNNGSTSSLTYLAFDYSLASGSAQMSSNKYVGFIITSTSATVTSYSVSLFVDPGNYSPSINVDRDATYMERKIAEMTPRKIVAPWFVVDKEDYVLRKHVERLSDGYSIDPAVLLSKMPRYRDRGEDIKTVGRRTETAVVVDNTIGGSDEDHDSVVCTEPILIDSETLEEKRKPPHPRSQSGTRRL